MVVCVCVGVCVVCVVCVCGVGVCGVGVVDSPMLILPPLSPAMAILNPYKDMTTHIATLMTALTCPSAPNS